MLTGFQGGDDDDNDSVELVSSQRLRQSSDVPLMALPEDVTEERVLRFAQLGRGTAFETYALVLHSPILSSVRWMAHRRCWDVACKHIQLERGVRLDPAGERDLRWGRLLRDIFHLGHSFHSLVTTSVAHTQYEKRTVAVNSFKDTISTHGKNSYIHMSFLNLCVVDRFVFASNLETGTVPHYMYVQPVVAMHEKAVEVLWTSLDWSPTLESFVQSLRVVSDIRNAAGSTAGESVMTQLVKRARGLDGVVMRFGVEFMFCLAAVGLRCLHIRGHGISEIPL